jgi:outer membrane receptor protein involved in Fe transport
MMRVLLHAALLALTLAMAGTASQAQSLTSGRLVDRDGRPIAGASVMAGETEVRTDADGAFVVPGEARILQVTVAGRAPVRVPAPTAQSGDIVLDSPVARHEEQVVVAAQRQEGDVLRVPGSVAVLTRRELDERLPRSTPDALMEVPGVFVQKTNQGGGSPYVRGLVGNQVLVLVDGVRLNNATYRLGPNQYLNTIDPATVERIEVVRGAGSVLYGTDALGGVVHIVTRTPTPRAAPFFEVRSTIKGAQGVPERSARVEFEGGVGPLAVLGGVSVKAFGDLRAGGDLGVRAPSGYDEADADLKVRWTASVRQALTLTVQRVRQEDVGRFDQVAQRGFASWAFDPQERWLGALAYTYDVRAAGVDRISVTAAAQRTREDRRSRRIGSLVEVVERDVVRVGSGSLDLAWRPLAGWRVVSGVDLTREQVDSGRVDTDARTGIGVPRRGLYADDAEAGSAAAFTQAQREFGRVHVESGVRYASYTVRSSAPTFGAFTMASSALVAQGGVSIAASAALHPYASVWQGFRAPNIDDVSALGSFDFGVEVPTRTLRPESSLGAEVGAKWRARRWSGAVALYRMGLRDLIERSRGTWLGEPTYEGQAVYVRENVGRAFVRGVEVESTIALSSSVSLEAWLARTYGQHETRNEPMRRIPPLHGLLGVRWQPVSSRGWLEVRWRGAARQDRLAAGDRDDHRIARDGTAAWHTLALRTGWRATPILELLAAVENGFDQPYRVHGSGIDGAGRTAWVGAHVRVF